MKVQIKQLEPNPYRDMAHYPIDREKVEALKASIKQTGFWDNILARKNNGKVQIAYGHHRLAALLEIYKSTDEVDIPIKPLDDATMLKIMANENMDEWKTAPAVIDETVKVAKAFLEEHPEEYDAHGGRGPHVGFRIIAKFLNWKEFRVQDSLERLGLIEQGVMEPEAVRVLPTERAARDFTKAVKQFKPTHTQQKKAAATIAGMAKGDRGEAAVRGAITEQIYRKEKPKHKEFKLLELREEIKEASRLARDLSSKLLTLTRFKQELADQVYRAEIKVFAIDWNVLVQAQKSFIGEKKNVKQLEG